MKKLLIFTALFITSVVFFNLTVFSVSQEQINKFTSTIDINKNGTITVSERIIYYFPVERHGIYREIPLVKTNQDGKKFKIDITKVSVFDEKGIPYKFTKTATNSDLTLKIGDPNKTISGTKTYIINYTVSGALTYFTDHDELYWNITGNSWDVPILSANTKILLPESPDLSQIKLACYTGSLNSTQSQCSTNFSDNTVNISTDGGLDTGEGLTVVVGFPKGLVEVIEPKPYSNTPSIGTIIFLLFLGIVVIYFYLIFPVWIFFKWRKDKMKTKNAKIVAAWFDPPKDTSGKYLSPAETSVLVDKSVDAKDITATIIQLAQKGYLKIIEDEKKGLFGKTKYSIKILGKSTEELEDFEKFMMITLTSASDDGLVDLSKLSGGFSYGSQLIKNAKFGKDLLEFSKKVSKGMVSKDLFINNPNETYENYKGYAITALFFLDIPLFLSSIFFGRFSALKTDLGVEKYGEAKSLLNFLKSQEEQLDFQAKNQMFFEKLLPYATAFGVEEVWAERFKDLKMIKPDWYEGNDFNVLTYTYFTQSMRSNFVSSYNHGMTSTRSSSGFGSGFGGGGFSGGGGGGGGGGSW